MAVQVTNSTAKAASMFMALLHVLEATAEEIPPTRGGGSGVHRNGGRHQHLVFLAFGSIECELHSPDNNNSTAIMGKMYCCGG